ncbi:MAG: efflux RND transporter periplasmic adaptor subunit [Deltaproteobacteria bacterium]|nr:MAG: efflux RND transporter periplasmic adaptor subunit [Deltaproteobacteria bacterium]
MMEKTSGMKKITSFLLRFLRVVIVLIIAIALAKFLISLKKEPEKKEIINNPVSVKVIMAKPVSKVMTVEEYGTVKPRKLVKITAEVSGRISYIHPSFIEGGEIEKGQVLIRIDQRTYKLNRQTGTVRIRQAKTDIEQLKQDIANLKNDIKLSSANLKLVEKELKRIKALSESQFASKNSLDRAEKLYLQAKIQFQNLSNRLSLTDTLMEQKINALDMANVDFQKADLALEKTSIVSDFDGFILNKSAEIGEYINPGQIMGSIYEKGNLDVDVRIPLENLRWIESFFEEGKTPKAKVTMANIDKMQPFVWDAEVVRIKASIDETTRTLPMTLEILKPELKLKNIFELKPGAFVKCSIIGETYKNIFVLPRYLLKRENILYTINSGHLKMKKVGILRKFEDEIYVDNGLNSGDKIIVSPLPGALDGMELKIKQNGK